MRLPYDTLAADGLKALGGVYGYIMRCGLEKPLVDLVYLRASQINGCAYCMDTHSHDLMQAGTPVQKIMIVSAWREARSLFTEREMAALNWTEAVTRIADTQVRDADFERARLHFSDKELADLTIAIGLINTYNRIAVSFRRAPERRAPLASSLSHLHESSISANGIVP
ncbi:MAG TPA: carboxymuconolactone decarboxylase family protein [Croceibacterium sp.]|nr:carboxymuconolactone decarboxylase family protein [Croceibacterium sp.]